MTILKVLPTNPTHPSDKNLSLLAPTGRLASCSILPLDIECCYVKKVWILRFSLPMHFWGLWVLELTGTFVQEFQIIPLVIFPSTNILENYKSLKNKK